MDSEDFGMRIFYQHPQTAFGDCMPFWWKGTYFVFHQRDIDLEHPLTVPFGWSLATTTDFVKYQDRGEVIPQGDDDDQDQFIYAGSVHVSPEGSPTALFTGYNDHFSSQGRPSQVLMRAQSADGVHWEKEGTFELPPQPGYDPDDWRDPVVVRDPDNDRWILVVGARLEGPKVQRTGRVVWYSSVDAEKWTFEGDLHAPGRYTMEEMPDLFQMGDQWYLLWTEYSDRSKTVYASGPCAVGPWTAPPDDAFDGRAYYAARTTSDGDRRFLFGWVANKAAARDVNPFVWAGTLVVHEIVQRADGTLGVIMPQELASAVMENGRALDPVVLTNEAGRSVRTLGALQETSYGVEATVRVAPGTRSFSILFGGDPELDDWYAYTVDFAERRVVFDRSPNFPWNRYDNKGLERPLPDSAAEQDIRVRLVVDETVAVLYLNDIALSTRVYEPCGTSVGIDVVGGGIEVKDIVVGEVPAPLSREY